MVRNLPVDSHLQINPYRESGKRLAGRLPKDPKVQILYWAREEIERGITGRLPNLKGKSFRISRGDSRKKSKGFKEKFHEDLGKHPLYMRKGTRGRPPVEIST